MEETLETNIVLNRNGIEAAREVGDSTVSTDYEEGKTMSFVSECASSQRSKDIDRAVSFAEDNEVSEMNQSSVKAGAVSRLHLPMQFIDCKTDVHIDLHMVQDNSIDPLEPGPVRILDMAAGTEHPEVDQVADTFQSAVTHCSFAFGFPELVALKIPTKKEITECDTFKKHQDARKVIAFAKNLELIETNKSSVIAKANSCSSLYLPTQFIDNNNHIHAEQHTVQDNGIESIEPDLTRIVNSVAEIEHPEVDQTTSEIKSSATHYSFAFMLQELNAVKTLTHKEEMKHDTMEKDKDVGKAISFAEIVEVSETNRMLNEVKSSVTHDSFAIVSPKLDIYETLAHKDGADITSCRYPGDADEDIASNDSQIVQVNEGHKEFKVQNVDEAELVTNDETVNVTDEKTPVCDGCSLFSRVPNILLDRVSSVTEINNQDTIGPLENPTFLKTLHYSVSHQPAIIQPVTKDELIDPKSNLDLHSYAVLQDPPDLDHGWAWVVLVAGFLVNALLGATIYASGVLILTILQEINPDLTKASWVGSVFVCAMCLSGPFVEVALKQCGARVTVFCSGILLTAGFVGASFATSISELILTHGVIAGVGAGFVINPVSVSVGQYFCRYRGLACGLMATGAGAGMLTGGTVISVLLNQYGLSGTYLIWGGMLSHTAVLGLLLRPSPEERLRVLERNIAATESYHGFIYRSNAASGFNSFFCSPNQSMLSGIDKIGHAKRIIGPQNLSTDNSGDPEIHLLKTDRCYEATHTAEAETTNQILPLPQIATSQQQKSGQDHVLGGLQHTSLDNSLTSTPRADNPRMVSTLNHNTLIKNASNSPLYSSAYILTASDPAYTSITPNHFSPISRSADGLEKSIHGRRFTRHSILSGVSCGDQEFYVNKPTFYSNHSVIPNRSRTRSIGGSWCSRLSKSLGLGIRQYTSLSASPLFTPKANSPPAIPSCSQHTLTSNLHDSSSFCNVHIATIPNLTHANDILISRPTSPPSIHRPLAQSKIQHHRTSLVSLSQHTSLSHSSVPVSYRGSICHSCAGGMDNESITSALISQLRPRDTMIQKYSVGTKSISNFMGSIGSIPTALAIVKDDVVRYETYSTAGIPEQGLKGTGIKVLDSLRLLRQKPFVIFLSVSFLWSFGESPVMIYLPSYAVSRGTSQIQASMLYTAMGTGSILGRFLSGLVASDSNIGPAILYSGCLGIAGLLIVLSPFITSTFVQQVIFSCLAGLYTGSLVPLSSLIAIDMLEIGKLGTGFGFISMAQGIGSLVGPPLASIFVTTYGYKNLFVCSGFALLSGSLLAFIMSVYIKETKEVELDEQIQKSKLENSVNKMSNTDSKPENGFQREENIGKEIAESSRMKKLNGAPCESSTDAADCHEHYSKEEKLGTIMEIADK